MQASHMVKNSLRTLAVLGCGILGVAVAQQGRGTVLGTVTDPTGAPVPGAPVVVTNVGTNIAFRTQTNTQGFYTAPGLPVGQYSVSITGSGFKNSVRSGITLEVDQRAEVNAQLELGTLTESVDVVGEAPLINTSDATVGKVIENRRIADLPVNGRSAFALVLLTPGVRSVIGGNEAGFVDRGQNLAAISINGGTPTQNAVIVDGGNAVNTYVPDLNANPAVDAIQEFKVQTSTMSAEFGFTSGGVVNVVTKSGTNRLQGTLYEFVRNDAFDARNTFSRSVAPFRYNQFGGAVGGPVVLPRLYDGRNRTFFFFNYEEWRYARYANPIATMPTALQRAGDFSRTFDASGKLITIYDPATTAPNPNGSGSVRSLFPGNIIPASRLDPVSVNFLRFYPLPNRTPSNAFADSDNYQGNVQEKRSNRQYTTRVDHTLSAKNTLFGRYMYYRHSNDQGASVPYPDPVVRYRYDNFQNHNIVLSDIHIFTPHVLNEFRVSVARQYFPFQVASAGGGWPQKLGLPSSVPPTTVPSIGNGLPGFTTGTVGLRGALTWQFYDSVSVVKGKHSLKIGAEIRIIQGNNLQPSTPSGNFTFPVTLTGNPQAQAGTGSAFATFMTGAVGSATVGTYLGNSQRGRTYSGFFQDDWRASRRLTLNLGLRYDYQDWPYESNNGVSNFNPFGIDPNYGLKGRMEYGGKDFTGSTINPYYRSFGPRFGFAYSLTPQGHTVLRGGYSIFYPLVFTYVQLGTSGFAQTTTAYNPPGGDGNYPAFQFSKGFPTPPLQPQGAGLGPSAFLGQGVGWVPGDNRPPMTQQWNIALQHQLPGSWLLESTWSANHGSRLSSVNYDLNQMEPKYYAEYGLALQDRVANPYAGVPGTFGTATITRAQSLRPYPYYATINVSNPTLGNSIYHAFIQTVQKRFSQGLTLLVSYTASKQIDDSVVTPIGFASGQLTPTFQNGKFDRRRERSVDPTDVSRNLVISGLYQLPFGKGKQFLNASNAALRRVVEGWQINTILSSQTGWPLPIRGASNNLADRPNSTGQSAALENPSAAKWFNTGAFVNPPTYTYGNVGRTLPDVRGPGLFNLDLSVTKDTQVSERMRVQLRVESFNVLNSVNLNRPGTTFVPGPTGQNQSAAFGVITSARDGRSLQFGLKLYF